MNPPPIQLCKHLDDLPSDPSSCYQSTCGRALIAPSGRKGADRLVVSRQAVDTGLDEDEAEFGVLVFAVALEMLPDGDGLRTVVNIQRS